MSGAGRLDAFVGLPAAWADPARLARLIQPGLRRETSLRLLEGRTAARAAALLARALPQAEPELLAPVDAALLLGPASLLQAASSAAGAICQARRVRALVMAADIAAFVERFGEAARQAALRHPTPAGIEPASGPLLEAVARDAALARDAWWLSLPVWAAERLRLAGLDPPASAPSQPDARADLLRLAGTPA